jgi:uncharacterized delta-60 repeat protein
MVRFAQVRGKKARAIGQQRPSHPIRRMALGKPVGVGSASSNFLIAVFATVPGYIVQEPRSCHTGVSEMKMKKLLPVLLVLPAVSAALAQDGSYDPTFGNQGRDWVEVTSGSFDAASTMIQLPNGDFFLGGRCADTNSIPSCAAWLTPDGALASGYGTSAAGTVWFKDFPAWPIDDNGIVSAVALPDNRVVVAVSRASGASYLAMVRADGTGLDSSIGNGAGYVAPTFTVAQVSRTPQGQIVAVGNRLPNEDAMVVARFNADLRLDTSFGTSGTTTVTFSDGPSYAFGMTLQRDGKIVLTGEAGDSQAVAIVRLTSQGQPDPDFGVNSDGKFENNFGLLEPFSTTVVEDEKGRLLFAGTTSLTVGSSTGNWLVGRLLSGGAMDPSFNGGNPEVFVPSGSSTFYQPVACCLAIQGDNHIVVGGTYDRSDLFDKYFAMVRFNENGTFDSTFGAGGRTYGDMSPESDARGDSPAAMVIVPGGIIIAGSTQATSETRFSAAKIKIDLLYASDFE